MGKCEDMQRVCRADYETEKHADLRVAEAFDGEFFGILWSF